jgi:hypothetical protein
MTDVIGARKIIQLAVVPNKPEIYLLCDDGRVFKFEHGGNAKVSPTDLHEQVARAK